MRCSSIFLLWSSTIRIQCSSIRNCKELKKFQSTAMRINFDQIFRPPPRRLPVIASMLASVLANFVTRQREIIISSFQGICLPAWMFEFWTPGCDPSDPMHFHYRKTGAFILLLKDVGVFRFAKVPGKIYHCCFIIFVLRFKSGVNSQRRGFSQSYVKCCSLNLM